jgi:hypothetical protein
MRTARTHRLVPAAAALLLACGAGGPTDADRSAVEPRFNSSDGPEWSAAENLGPVVNSPLTEQNPAVTADELTLYFQSDRPGGLGGVDVWVTRRTSRHSPWQPPVNLGPPVNTPFIDAAPSLSPDGHLLFIHSNRPGGLGINDIWVARRSGSKDEEDWETPVNLGPDVNTADDEQGPDYVASDGGGAIYFNRGNTLLNLADLYRAELKRDGRTDGPAQPATELNAPAFTDAGATLRADAREVLFGSTRPGGFGGNDIWVSTRQSANHPWSPPQNAGLPLNTPFSDLTPELTQDALTLYVTSNRPGGFGGNDLWVSTRHASSKR